MEPTDSKGAQVLEALSGAACAFVVLHQEASLAAGEVATDIDLAVDAAPDEVVAQILPELRRNDLHPIMRWPYDRCSVTYFFMNSSGSDGVQLDLVADPLGRGRYGFRTDALLASAVQGVRWPTLDPIDAYLYLLRKRQVKRRADVVDALLASAPASSDILERRATEAFSSTSCAALHSMIESGAYVDPKGAAFDRRGWNIAANLGWYLTRTRLEVGAAVRILDTERPVVEEALEPIRALLPRVEVRPSSLLSKPGALVRRRAMLSVRVGEGGVWGADITIEGVASPEHLRSTLVRQLDDLFMLRWTKGR